MKISIKNFGNEYFRNLQTFDAVTELSVQNAFPDPVRALGYSRKYPHPPYGRHWKSCKKCSMSMTGNPQISPKFCKFLPEFQENHSNFCEILEFLKILNQQALESCKDCSCRSWKS